MKNLFFILFLLFIFQSNALATVFQGGIMTTSEYISPNKVVDKATGRAISNAKIRIPNKNLTTYTNNNGEFVLNTKITSPVILSVEKENYKPFSVTLNQYSVKRPFVLAIEKSSAYNIKIDTNLCHIGDNNYSSSSANASQFKSQAKGHVYKNKFFISKNNLTKRNYLKIGSIIGIDTALAKGMGQNRIVNSFATPPSVYLNGVKIAEIKLNGDNQKISLPSNLIKWNQSNEIAIVAGRNLMQTAYIDYDDVEFMNLSVETY